MALTHEEIQELKREIFAEADEKYVAIDDCNTVQSENQKRFANDDKRIDLILHKQEIGNNAIKKNNWLTTTILGIIIAGVIGYIFLNFGG